MGFRNKRRFRGGGGGQHHHHHCYGTGEPNGLQPGDDVGNRRSFKPVQLPPEDLGNRKDPDEEEWVPEDAVGNRIDAAPTHELSGILLELDGKRRRRRPKGVAAPERVGRYFVGGVNPLIATNIPRPFPGKSLDESLNGGGQQLPAESREGPRERADVDGGEGGEHEGEAAEGERTGRRRRRRGRGREQVDGVAAQEVSERRAQRFFDFEEDDRFDYTLKSDPEQKRKDAEGAVRSIVTESGRDATVLARLIEDGDRPKILVTIDERGPSPSLPPERRGQNAQEPLFVMGNAALMSLNYLVNKIVNRYPDDRIRLAILPAMGEKLYLEALADHQKIRGAQPARRGAAPPQRQAAALSPPPTAADGPVPLGVVEVPELGAEPSVVVTPAPIGVAAPEEAFEEPLEPPEHIIAPTHVEPAAVLQARADAAIEEGGADEDGDEAEEEAEEEAAEETAAAAPARAARPRKATKKAAAAPKRARAAKAEPAPKKAAPKSRAKAAVVEKVSSPRARK
jgi:hypothetical protein